MTPEETIKRLKKLEQAIISELPNVLSEEGFNMRKRVAKRIESGVDYDGGEFGQYSTNQWPIHWSYSDVKKIPRAGTSRLDAWRKRTKRDTISYKEFRDVYDLNTDRIRFQLSGDMIDSIDLIKTSNTKNKYKYTYGVKLNTEAGNKLLYANQRAGGNILRPSDSEKKITQDKIKNFIKNKINEIL